mgnify:CR=1 FL=1
MVQLDLMHMMYVYNKIHCSLDIKKEILYNHFSRE